MFSIISELVKYKLSLTILFSSATGYFTVRNTITIDFLFAITGVFLVSSGCSVLNQYCEKEYDSIMPRTTGRPIVSNKISAGTALLFSITLLFIGSICLLFTGILPFFLGLSGIFLYNWLYTRLKRITLLSIIPGVLVGAVPPLIGFYAAGGTEFNHVILIFTTFMLFWQISHFCMLLAMYGEEYRSAGFRTLADYLSRNKIINLAFFMIFLTACIINISSISLGLFSTKAYILMVLISILFIFSIGIFLLGKYSDEKLRYAFILMNLFGILFMILIIVDSVLAVI